MPKIDQVFNYYANSQNNNQQNQTQSKNVFTQVKQKVSTFLGEKAVEANILARKGEIYNPNPSMTKNISDELVKQGLKIYTENGDPESLRAAKGKLEQAQTSGFTGFYDPDSITRAIRSINDQLLQYKLKEAKVL